MSEAHPDADLVKVTRTTTTYEPATKQAKQTETVSKARNPILPWVIGVVAVAAVAVGGVLYYNAQPTSASAQHSAVANDQNRAQTLNQQADSSQQAAQAAQQSADQARARATTLTADANHDRHAATLAAARADAAGKGAPTN
jgi:uncharacterized protein HemX